jgi:hypothetical protein
MMTFRKLSASSVGQLLRAYFTEHTPEAAHEPDRPPGPHPDPGGRLTAYYTGRDSRAIWRPDMPASVAGAIGIDPTKPPKDAELDRLFEAKRGDTGKPWSRHHRDISAYDLTLAPHKSVSLAAEFAATDAESAAIWNAIDRANDATMRYVARELGWARRGNGGRDGADPGAVAWASFRHHTARPTVAIQDGPGGVTYIEEARDVPGDPHAHIHNALFNVVVTDGGRVGSLDTQRLRERVHEFGAYFQARLADELRRLGARVRYDKNEQAIVLAAIPDEASDVFSKSRRQVERSAAAYAKDQGLDWDDISAFGKRKILAATGLAARHKKNGAAIDREVWRAQAEAIGWEHKTVFENVKLAALSDEERHDRAYQFAARHLAAEFHTSAVIDHDKLRLYAARGLIGVGIAGGIADIDRVVDLIEQRGIMLNGEHVSFIVGIMGDKVRVTNTAQVRIEESLAQEASRAAHDRSGALSTEIIRDAIAVSPLDFTKELAHGAAQKAAIYALGRSGALTLLTGGAGAGKTAILQPLVAAWKADTRFDPDGRQIIGVATAWKQADALKREGAELRNAGIDETWALQPFLWAVDSGVIAPTWNTVLVVDEVSQIGPRSMLKLLELQARTGMTIKALGDREQAQAIEAGDTIEIMRRALPKSALPELLSTIRQTARRDREIAGLFRHSKAEAALAMKREDGTAILVGGDQDQVVGEIADLYIERRDFLRASGAKDSVTVSTPTNDDAADISRAIRARLQARGEIGTKETIYAAIDQRGETYDLPIAIGDRLRLFRRTWVESAEKGKKGGYIGNNGDVVEVVAHHDDGLLLRAADGRTGKVEWRRLRHEGGRLLLGFGYAVTIDAAQGTTSAEHINALPRGTAALSAFKTYVAESRARGTTWTMIAEGAVLEAEKLSRALGDQTPITSADLWKRVATHMSEKPYKPLGTDLVVGARRARDHAIDTLIQSCHRLDIQRAAGRNHGNEFRQRKRAEIVRKAVGRHIADLGVAARENMALIHTVAHTAVAHFQTVASLGEVARQRVEKPPPRPRGPSLRP